MVRFEHDKRVSVALTTDLREGLERAARELRLSRSDIVRLALAEYLAKDPRQALRRYLSEAATHNGDQRQIAEEVRCG